MSHVSTLESHLQAQHPLVLIKWQHNLVLISTAGVCCGVVRPAGQHSTPHTKLVNRQAWTGRMLQDSTHSRSIHVGRTLLSMHEYAGSPSVDSTLCMARRQCQTKHAPMTRNGCADIQNTPRAAGWLELRMTRKLLWKGHHPQGSGKASAMSPSGGLPYRACPCLRVSMGSLPLVPGVMDPPAFSLCTVVK